MTSEDAATVMHDRLMASVKADEETHADLRPNVLEARTASDTFNEQQEAANPEKINFVIPVFTCKTDSLGGNNNIMKTEQIVEIGVSALAAVPGLVKNFEDLFGSTTGLGAAKKAAVTGDILKTVATQIQGDSTGGQADWLNKFMGEISTAIDNTVTMFKNLGVFGKSDTPVDPLTAITQAATSLVPAVASMDPAAAKMAGVIAATAEQVQAIAPEVVTAAKGLIDAVNAMTGQKIGG